ncbi:thioredoxin domain-containing protein 9-like [Trifolium pratense]|uniref:Thioredoxin domain-containing protein 9-like n=1 Tax=Trifolium pratense TaxID=57577 RepID=A0A2K3NLG3_TRIPR|nr:thioredoxin domain-containing protein 9-like [Trifolium pratense]
MLEPRQSKSIKSRPIAQYLHRLRRTAPVTDIKMNPDAVKSTLTNLAFGNVIAAAARNYQKELLSEEKAAQSSSINEEVDLDDLMDGVQLNPLKRSSSAPVASHVVEHQLHSEGYDLPIESNLQQLNDPRLHSMVAIYNGPDDMKMLLHAKNWKDPYVSMHFYIHDPELEKLHADRIAAFKKEAEKREAWKKKGHGEFREVTEGDFLGEVTGSEKVICHFYHKEFYRCKIMDKHLKSLSTKHIDTKFIRLDAENAPFFVTKLAIKTLPCVILFRQGVAVDRLVGFQDLGAKDDFTTRALEVLLIKKGIIAEKKDVDEEDQEYDESKRRTVRSSAAADSDSD